MSISKEEIPILDSALRTSNTSLHGLIIKGPT